MNAVMEFRIVSIRNGYVFMPIHIHGDVTLWEKAVYFATPQDLSTAIGVELIKQVLEAP